MKFFVSTDGEDVLDLTAIRESRQRLVCAVRRLMTNRKFYSAYYKGYTMSCDALRLENSQLKQERARLYLRIAQLEQSHA